MSQEASIRAFAFVMAGAVAVTALGYRIVLARPRPLFSPSFTLPSSNSIDARLVLRPAIFGIGWGLSGLCPGPAFASLGLGAAGVLAFVPAMTVGMAAARWAAARQDQLAATLPGGAARQSG